ncbi:hypothetical protein ACLBXM_00095 [Xanthobacteraceae bacterium A53D]
MQQDDPFTEPDGILRPFPPAEDVFVPEQIGLVRHLHPLVSVDLAAANPDWSGWAHILSPIEPHAGEIGEHTTAFHGPHARTNGFMLALEGDRYRFLGDARYFLMENERDTLGHEAQDAWDELAAHYPQAEASFRRKAASYAKLGHLHLIDAQGQIREGNPLPQSLIERLGGTVGYANWTVTTQFDVEPKVTPGGPEPDEIWPISPAGRRFHFVASTPGWLYRDDGADEILMFYEPVERLVFLTFDYS